MGILGSGSAGQARYSGQEHNLKLTQAVFGTTLPILSGTRRLAMKLLFYGGFYSVAAASSGGKGTSGKGGDQYDYYADMVAALASGSASGGCQGILNVWDQQGKLQNQSGSFLYTIPTGGGTVTPSSAAGAPAIQQDLGVSKTANYSVGPFTDYGSGGSKTLTGTQQVPLQKTTGTLAAGLYSFNAATSSYSFSAADAGTVVAISYSSVFSLYYFQSTQAAQVPTSAPYQVSTNNQQYFWADNGVINVATGLPLTRGAGTLGYTQSAGVYTFTSDMAGGLVYINYTFTSDSADVTNSSTLNLTFFGGTLGQTPASYMQSKYPGAAFGFTGTSYILANPMALGEDATTPSYNFETVGLNIFAGGGLDAHPCDHFRTLLYDAFLGCNFPAANVDPWVSCYAYWAASGYLGSYLVDTQVSVADAMKEITTVGNVGAFFSAGLLKMVPYGDATVVGNGYTYTPNTTPAATLTWNNLLPPTEEQAGKTGSEDVLQVEQKAPQDCWNYVQANWCNRANDYNNELIPAQNDAFITAYGRRIESPQTWDWITTAASAAWALHLRLNRECYIRNTYKFWLPMNFCALEPMDMVMLPTGEAVRITQIEDDLDGRRAVEAEQWAYGTGNVTVYPKQPPTSYQPNISTGLPGDAVPIVVQNTLTQSGGTPYLVQIAATGQSANWGGCNVLTSIDGETYTLLGTVTSPSLIGVLSAALPMGADPDLSDILSVDCTLSNSTAELVSVGQQLADKLTTLCAIVDQGGETCELIAYETATLTASSRYNLSYLRRGAFGSTIGAHTPGALFAFMGPNYQFAKYTFGAAMMGHVLYVKLQSFNLAGKQVQNEANCPVYEFTLGFQNGQAGALYMPSSAQPVLVQGTGTQIGVNNAFDGVFNTVAIFDGGAIASGGGNSSALYGGFPSIVLSYNATLYVSYQNLRGYSTSSGEPYVSGGFASCIADTGSYTKQMCLSGEPGAATVWLPQGTATLTIPAGTNLSSVTVSAEAQTYAANIAGDIAAHLEIVQIWIQ